MWILSWPLLSAWVWQHSNEQQQLQLLILHQQQSLSIRTSSLSPLSPVRTVVALFCVLPNLTIALFPVSRFGRMLPAGWRTCRSTGCSTAICTATTCSSPRNGERRCADFVFSKIPTQYGVCDWPGSVCWVGKHINGIVNPTNSQKPKANPTQEKLG